MSSSGKTYLTRMLGEGLVKMTSLTEEDVTVLELDNFYRPIEDVYDIQGINPRDDDALKQVNWDDPNLIDYERLIGSLADLIDTGQTTVGVYNKSTGKYLEDATKTYRAGKIVLVESFLLFSANIAMEGNYSSGKEKRSVLEDSKAISDTLLDLITLRIGVICDELEGWRRRIARDTQETDRDLTVTDMYWHRDAVQGAHNYIYPLLYAEHNNIFQLFIDNTTLRVVDIDNAFCAILEGVRAKGKSVWLLPKYQNSKSRMNWFSDHYEPVAIRQAKQAYATFRTQNHT